MVQKLVVGITGGIGTGKSSVARLFRKYGAEVIDADQIAHDALKKGSPVFDQIAVLFGDAWENHGKKLNREKIAEEVFSNPEKRKQLEALIHPYVYEKIKENIEETVKRTVIVEVPLLFEAGFQKLCDKVLTVKCNRTVKQKRFKGKRFSAEEIRTRENAQMPESLKIQKADFIIDNSGSISQTTRQVEQLWHKFESLSKGATKQ
ncbi:MAG TPA: dephospho-CoA kinase [Candidatus Omnitrophota bacterium]|nr:dephospho-CoA kinase [Candidatus Omnitrophota bacterium]